jgi:hypothetical protein
MICGASLYMFIFVGWFFALPIALFLYYLYYKKNPEGGAK